jgi:hypothetical protein
MSILSYLSESFVIYACKYIVLYVYDLNGVVHALEWFTLPCFLVNLLL